MGIGPKTRVVLALASVLAPGIVTRSAALPLAVDGVVKVTAANQVSAVSAAHRKRIQRSWQHYGGQSRSYRARIPAPECPGLYSWNPANPDRGYCDPGFAYHGNVNGCAFDQGYGRWASCDTLR